MLLVYIINATLSSSSFQKSFSPSALYLRFYSFRDLTFARVECIMYNVRGGARETEKKAFARSITHTYAPSYAPRLK